MKTFIYKSLEDLIEGIKAYKRQYKKRLKFMVTEKPAKKLIGIEDVDREYYWSLPYKIAEKLAITDRSLGLLAAKLSTKPRKK